jgi:hypothetical protein
MVGDSGPKTSQLCQGIPILRTCCWFPSSLIFFESLLKSLEDFWSLKRQIKKWLETLDPIDEPVVSGNLYIEDLLLIPQLSEFFWKSFEDLWSQKDKTKYVWRLWTQDEPVVSRNVQIEDFLLIPQVSFFFSKSPEMS